MKISRENTYSICPVCRKRIPAARVRCGNGIRLEKHCPDHGDFSSVLWSGYMDPDEWKGTVPPVGEKESRACEACPGLRACGNHRRGTCCTLLEVTGRCNMHCRYCFADGAAAEDPSLEQVKEWISDLTVPGETFLQLSGGEPTVRDDLPEITAFAKKCRCKYVQLNTNGLRLAEEEGYVKALAEAGLSFVFLSFDSTEDETYLELRGKPMMDVKRKVIENCEKHGIGVTLVPVIVPGVNDGMIGDIIRFGAAHSPVVRGIHFQPVSYFGRIPHEPEDKDRFTMDRLMYEIIRQGEGLVKEGQLTPSCCDHPMCGFHGDFIVMPDGTLMPLSGKKSTCCGPAEPEIDPAEMNREFIGRRWSAGGAAECCCGEPEEESVSCCCGADDNVDAKSAAEECCCGEPEEEASCCCEADDSCCEDACCEDSCCAEPQEQDPACCCGADDSCCEESCCEETCCGDIDMTDIDTFLARAKTYSFTITAMCFQDAWNLDYERLMQCSLHVYENGRIRPFCAHYIEN